MISKEVVKLIERYTNTLELFGSISFIELNTLLYIMFIDEYYETRLQNSKIDPEDPNGLSDCLVKKLNIKLKQLEKQSSLLKSIRLTELPNLSHWIIPDVDEPENYIENNVLYLLGQIENNILITNGEFNNNNLIL